MKKLFSLILMPFFLVACNNIDGQLNVSSDFKLKNYSGETQLIRVGTYTADLSTSSFGKRITLKLNNDRDQRFDFRMPDSTKLPSNGTFKFKSSDIGQDVDLVGTVNTKVTDSEVRQDFLTCTYTEPTTVCFPGPNGQPVCTTQMRTVYGSQFVSYLDRVTDQSIVLNIVQANMSDSSAEFSGRSVSSQRVILNQTPCR